MKLKIACFLLVLFLSLDSSFTSKTSITSRLSRALTHLKKSLSKVPTVKKAQSNSISTTPVFSGTFWVQKFAPTNDAIRLLSESWSDSQKRYLVINNRSIYYGKSEKTKAIIQDQIMLNDIFDSDYDKAETGKCCHHITFVTFPEVKNCGGKPCSQVYGGGLISESQKDNAIELARYCMEINIFRKVHWRICHREQDMINRLKINIVTQVLKSQVKYLSPQIMTKILMNANYSPLKVPKYWNWLEQDNWGGNCNSDVMQSPLPISSNNNSGGKGGSSVFLDCFYEDDIEIKVSRNMEEVVVNFVDDPGYLRMKINNVVKQWVPKRLSFRFPAEHVVNGNRYDGEIIIEMLEDALYDDRKLSVTEGFNWVIPIMFKKDAALIGELENLSPDFWKFELETLKSFYPRNVKTGKKITFDLNKLMDHVMALKSNFALYLGSQTTPPCLERVIQMINYKPLFIPNCQFIVFRENSLTTNRKTEIHARKLPIGGKNKNKPPTFTIPSSNMIKHRPFGKGGRGRRGIGRGGRGGRGSGKYGLDGVYGWGDNDFGDMSCDITREISK